MKRIQLTLALVTITVFCQASQIAHAHPGVRWSIGLNFGPPAYYHRPWYGYGWAPYYAPAPVYYEAAPVIVVRPSPVVVQSSPSVVTVPPASTSTPAPLPAIVTARSETPVSPREETLLTQLADDKDSVRRDAAMDLGRLRSQKAIEPLQNLLAKDTSPIVRDAAARALGLIGSQRSLNALIYAAQADNDRDVRHSAQFAVEIIRTNLRGN